MTIHKTLLIMAVAIALIPGCSTASGRKSASAPSRITQLGIINVTDGEVTQHAMGGDRLCIIRPTVRHDGTVDLAITIREAGNVLARPSVRTFPDKSFEVECDGVGVGMTVHIKP